MVVIQKGDRPAILAWVVSRYSTCISASPPSLRSFVAHCPRVVAGLVLIVCTHARRLFSPSLPPSRACVSHLSALPF